MGADTIRGVQVAIMALAITVMANLFGLVWGASKLTSTVEQLEVTLRDLRTTELAVQNEANQNAARLDVLEALRRLDTVRK